MLRTPVRNSKAAARAKGTQAGGNCSSNALARGVHKQREETGEATKGQLVADSYDVLSWYQKGRAGSRSKGSRNSDLCCPEKSLAVEERWNGLKSLC